MSKSFPKKSSTKKRALPNATTDEAVKLTRDEKKRLLERHHNNLRDKSAPVEGLAFEQQLRRVAIAGGTVISIHTFVLMMLMML